MKCFNFESVWWRSVWKEDWLVVCDINDGLKQLCTAVKTYLLKCKAHLKTILNAYTLLYVP